MYYTIELCLKILNYGGLHPFKTDSKIQIVWFLVISCSLWIIIYLVFLNLYYKKNITMIELTEAFSTSSMVIHGIQRSTSLFLKRYQIADLLEDMEKRFFNTDCSDLPEEDLTFCTSVQRYTKKTFTATIVMCTVHVLIFITKTFLVQEDVPLFVCYRPQWLSFYYLWAFQSFVISFGIWLPIVSFDSLLMTILNLTRIQLQIVNAKLKKLFSFKNQQDMIYYRQRVIILAKHHGFLLRYINDINQTFSTPLLAYMAILIFSLCLEMYKVSTSRSFEMVIGAASYTTVALWGFIALFGLPAEMMINEVNKICDSIYSSTWYNHPEEKHTVLMIIANSQRKVSVQAGKFLKVNLATSMNTVKTMVSYCMFLQTVIVEDQK